MKYVSARVLSFLVAVAALGCSAGHDDIGWTEDNATAKEAIRHGFVVTPFGPGEAPDITRAVVLAAGCSGTLIDRHWVLGAAHCEPNVGGTVTSFRPSGDVTATIDRVVAQPGNENGDLALMHLASPIDIPQVPLVLSGTTQDILGNAVDCYGYGAIATGDSCESNDDCPSGQGCSGGQCLTWSDGALRMATLSTVGDSNDRFFLTSTNGFGQMILPGDSGGPCFLNGKLAGVNAFWYFDLSGGGHSSVPRGADWLTSNLTDAGFVRVTATTGTSTPSSSVSMNSSGGTNTVTWIATGRARVSFPGLGNTQGGNVQVTAFGSGTRCKVASWTPSGSTMQVNVNCFNSSGAAASTPFAASYLRRAGAQGPEGGYVWANQPTTVSYTPFTLSQWNSTGAANTITRNGVGSYTVSFPGQSFSRGTVEVTAYGTDNSFCKVENWGFEQVNVRCFLPSGAAVDTMFTAKYTSGSPTFARSFAYAWADQPSAASYTPHAAYQGTSVATSCGQMERGPVTITRSSVGNYQVNFAGLPGDSPARTHVKVTGYGSGSDTCKVVSWTGGASSSSASVACFTRTGAAVDAMYTISFSSTRLGPC